MILLRPVGRSGSSPFACASAQAKSCPGTTERSGESSVTAGLGTGTEKAAPAISRGGRPARDERRARGASACSRLAHGGQALVVGADRPDREEPVERRQRAVDEIRGRQRLGRDATRLEQLQRDLARGRELGAAADHEHPADEGERDRDLRQPPLERRQRVVQLRGDGADAVGDQRPLPGGMRRPGAPAPRPASV